MARKQLGGKLGSSVQTDLGVNNVGDLLQFSEDYLLERYGVNTCSDKLCNFPALVCCLTLTSTPAHGYGVLQEALIGDEVEGRLLPKSHGSGKTFPGPQALKTITSVRKFLSNFFLQNFPSASSSWPPPPPIHADTSVHMVTFYVNCHDPFQGAHWEMSLGLAFHEL
ncbi:hypothetical protein IFM89_019401 [Coptis chinensis]|uniref:Uncharacterized protein n=1 Tax=Coptis chinensis TaxID=261450 RepID=A0A835IP34_9MAGN|nr:hypothetical protein IFM89_019401 [Coptis chinensis]